MNYYNDYILLIIRLSSIDITNSFTITISQINSLVITASRNVDQGQVEPEMKRRCG